MPFLKNTININTENFDVLIAGAGVAGCTAALFLQQAGYRVGLLHRPQLLPFKTGESLPPIANKLLQQLGTWEKFKAQNHLPCYGNKSVWGATTPQVHDFLSHPYGHGWHINRLLFEQLLLDEAVEKGARLLAASTLPKVISTSPAWQLQTAQGMVSAPFLFDAGGRNTRLPQMLGLTRNTLDKQVALCGFFEGIRIQAEFSFIEAVSQGWWYTAPLPDGKVITSLFTLPGCYKNEVTATETLCAQLQTNPALQQLLLHKQPVYTKLLNAGSSILNKLHTSNYLAIGDAALTFDPISSHGMVMAMTSARDAAEAFDLRQKGNMEALKQYNHTLQEVFSKYELSKQQVYASEWRWPDEPYWKKKSRLLVNNT
jgi:flavin-dependent dehydrogenase